VKRLVAIAGLVAVMLMSAAACNSSTQGEPSAQNTTGVGQPSSSDPTGSAATSGGTTTLPVDEPCSLLSSADLRSIEVSGQPTQDEIGTEHACEMDNSNGHIIVGVRTDVGLAGFQSSGGTVHGITVGSHQAKEVLGDTGTCLIGIGVSDSSRVDVSMTGFGSGDPCVGALSVAKLVEPKLP
jgi:hypothetical protein